MYCVAGIVTIFYVLYGLYSRYNFQIGNSVCLLSVYRYDKPLTAHGKPVDFDCILLFHHVFLENFPISHFTNDSYNVVNYKVLHTYGSLFYLIQNLK